MQQAHFFVSRNGEQIGPITLDEIVARVLSKGLDVSDYIFDEAHQDWVMLMAHPHLKEKLNSMKPAAPPPSTMKLHETERPDEDRPNEWYVLKGDNKFGPFAYSELLRMLQDKSVFEFDYVWHAKLSAWERLASLPDFAPNQIRKLRDSGQATLNEVFFRRRHARATYGASILVHNNKSVFKGKSLEISAGGAGIVIESAQLQPGDRIYLHFKPGDGVPPFNAICEVVAKRFVNSSDKDAPVQYGVKFTEITKQTQDVLNSFTAKVRAAA